MNRFGAALSTAADLHEACEQVAEKALEGLAGARPNLALLFASHEHAMGFEELPRRLRSATGADLLLGAAGETIIGGGSEVEEGPALALWLGSFPEGEVE